MKAVPILVITNALALALVIILFVQQSDLESQLAARRTPVQRDVPADTVDIDARLARLERILPDRAPLVADEAEPVRAEAEDEDPATAAPEGSDAGIEDRGEEPQFDGAEMEVFRRKVRRAQELNAEEDQVQRVVRNIDRLVDENRIAPLNDTQKKRVARTILTTRRKVPEIWRNLARSGALEGVSREDRGKVIRTEYESLRIEAQKQLEEVMPAADAKTVLDDTMADRGMMRGFGGPGAFRGGRAGGGRDGR